VPDDRAAGGLRLRIEAELGADLLDDRHVPLGLLEVFFPFFLQVLVLNAAKRGLVDLDAAYFDL
jgi:hypothetical protein